jgi:hypothetical protein
MSKQYPGGIITKSPATPTGPYQTGAAPGIWTLDQQLQYQQQGVWPTAGLSPNYIEDVFSTYLYTGNGSTQTITNGIDLSTKGGLVWQKTRSIGTTNNVLCDTARGVNAFLFSNDTLPSINNGGTDAVYSYNANGFSTGTVNGADINLSGETAVSWTFRKQPKFFDIVTYTGDGVSGRQIPHNLASVPGCIIIKRTDTTAVWTIFHNGLSGGITGSRILFDTAAATVGSNITAVDSSTFTVISTGVNSIGGTYVAYLFAHNAGGFGLTGSDNVISCGSYTGTGAVGLAVTLGYEPQWVLVKRATGGTGSWYLFDTMRGMTANSGANTNTLNANTYNAEIANSDGIAPSATGFTLTSTSSVLNGSGSTYIYIAIRRGPMAVPTDATKVFSPVARTGTGSNTTATTGFVTDLVIECVRDKVIFNNTPVWDRLRGANRYLYTNNTSAEGTGVTDALIGFDTMDGVRLGPDSSVGMINFSSKFYINWNFRRAPSFFDEVCYTGTGVTSRVLNHNLTVTPEMIIYKTRSLAGEFWGVYTATTGIGNVTWLNRTNETSAQAERTLAVSSTTITIGSNTEVNGSGSTYVAYLFATCAGVSKVGTYTGNGTTQTINCGFTGGARFVLLKRTDAAGDWYVYDTARGMTTLTDPYLLINSTAAEVATLGSVTTVSTGFALNSTILAAINVSAGTYIFLAVA